MKLFFATDIHGSDVCFRKLLNAGKAYGVDAVILGGDMTGKIVVTIVKEMNGTYRTRFQEADVQFNSEQEVQRFVQRLRDMGLYFYVSDPEEMNELQRNRAKADDVFRCLQEERMHEWVALADQKLKAAGAKLFVCPGNDDDRCINKILDDSACIENLEGKVFQLDNDHEMISTGFSNPTPWHTARELTESQLSDKIIELVGKVKNVSSCIFNFHVPPFNSKIDECAELDSEFRVVMTVAGIKKKPAGSTAVREAIEKHQPLLALFGHIHEGRGYSRIGRTLCINPGSNYTEGVLNGCVVELRGSQVISYQLTTG